MTSLCHYETSHLTSNKMSFPCVLRWNQPRKINVKQICWPRKILNRWAWKAYSKLGQGSGGTYFITVQQILDMLNQYPKGKPSSLTNRHGRFAGQYKSQLWSMLLSDRRRGCWSFWQFGGAQEFLDSWYENTLSFKLPDAQQEKTDNYRKMSYFSVLLFRKHPSSVIRRIWSGSRSGALKTSGSIRNFDPEEF